VTYSINAAKLRQLYGRSLQTRARDGSDTTIHIPVQPAGWPRSGVEAYGLKTHLDVRRTAGTETIVAFLKIFKTEVREREIRTRFLIETELAKKHDFFFGIPFGWLGRLNINGVDVIAHFTRMVHGPYDGGPEDFGRLRSSGRWARFANDTRHTFAAELAATVAGLERAGIIHGDISSGNILVGQASAGREICILCDYDGFQNHLAPRLPRKNGKMPCRPLGTPGYQYPELIAALEKDQHNDADIWPETDRFALAVAICEMVVWSDDIETMLQEEGRGQFLTKEVITARDLSRLPYRILDAFPAGFLLLDKALHATGPASMPSPEDWLRMLGFDDEPHEYHGRPVITVFRTRGNLRAKQSAFRLASATGDFGVAVPALAGIVYHLESNTLEFRFGSGHKVKRRRDGRLADITAGVGSVVANPGDTYYVNDLELEIADYVEVQQSI
jgi:hypothetical protein